MEPSGGASEKPAYDDQGNLTWIKEELQAAHEANPDICTPPPPSRSGSFSADYGHLLPVKEVRYFGKSDAISYEQLSRAMLDLRKGFVAAGSVNIQISDTMRRFIMAMLFPRPPWKAAHSRRYRHRG